jgi:putative protein-disulfide isomerase
VVNNSTGHVIHYVYDPLCGWCYGASPLVSALSDVPGLRIELHGGGMFAGAARRPVTPELRAYVGPHDRRISALTGQPFGSGYTDGLLKDPDAMLDSEPPITAVLAASELGGADAGLALLTRVQQAHYVDGRRIADAEVLRVLAIEQGLDGWAFAAAFERLSGSATQAHLTTSRQLLSQSGGQGFPTLLLQRADGRLQGLDIGRFHGQRQAWLQHLKQALA